MRAFFFCFAGAAFGITIATCQLLGLELKVELLMLAVGICWLAAQSLSRTIFKAGMIKAMVLCATIPVIGLGAVCAYVYVTGCWGIFGDCWARKAAVLGFLFLFIPFALIGAIFGMAVRRVTLMCPH